MTKFDILFWIICRISEEAGVKSPPNTITAFYHDAMFPSFQKFFVKKDFPLRMHEFSSAKGKKCLAGGMIAGCLFCSEIFEACWELQGTEFKSGTRGKQ
jgi:hypothetical protein